MGVEVQTGHVGLNVTDLSRSVRFYSEVFGLEVLKESDTAGRRFAFLGAGTKTVLTLWQQSEGRFNAGAPGLHHLSFRVEDINAVKEIERKVRETGAHLIYDGVVPHAEGADSGGLFFEDPDGTRLEGFVRADRDGTISWPDYQGNSMFNTLGNLYAHPPAGLLFVNFEEGHTLQISGSARIIWDASRLVQFRVAEVIETRNATPLRWQQTGEDFSR